MTDEVNVFLHRWASGFAGQAHYDHVTRTILAGPPVGCRSSLVEPASPLTRRSRMWVSCQTTDVVLHTNGIVTIVDADITADDAAAVIAYGVPESSPMRLLCRMDGRDEALKIFSIWTTAVLALDEISRFDRERPRWSGELSPDDVERLLKHPLLRYAAGVGADRRTVAPWRKHTESYRARVSELSQFWARSVIPTCSEISQEHPASRLFTPLQLMRGFSHDEDILSEYETRLSSISAESARVAGRVGGFLGILAVVIGFYSLVPALVIGGVALAYFYGFIEIYRSLGRLFRRSKPEVAHLTEPLALAVDESTLSEAVKWLQTAPSAVLVGSYLAAIDFACAFLMWLDLVESCALPDLPRIGTTPGELSNASLIVVGGPLSVPKRRDLPAPTCALKPVDAVFTSWDYEVRGKTLDLCARDDSVGCVSVAKNSPRFIYVDGARGIGVELATSFLRDAITGVERDLQEQFVLLRYDARARSVERIPTSRDARFNAASASESQPLPL